MKINQRHVMKLILIGAFSVVGAVGCSSSSNNNNDSAVKSDGNTSKDSTVNTDAPSALTCNNDCSDYVFGKVIVPTQTGEYGYDFDGKGPKNRLGQILGIVNNLLQGASLQDSIDLAFARGRAIILMRAQGDQTNATQAATQIWSGAQVECCTGAEITLADCLTQANQSCFNGSYEFSIAQDSPQTNLLGGKVTSNSFAFGPASVVLKLPLLGNSTVRLSLSEARLSGKFASGKIENGVVNGAIAKDKLDSELLVDVKDLLNAILNDSTVQQSVKDALLTFFDKEEPKNEISTSEIKNSTLGDLLVPDVDLDGDGTVDALSLGIGFTAVSAKIKE